MKTQTELKMRYLPNWKRVEDLKSGETESGLLLSIRKALWPSECSKRARLAVNTADSRRRKSNEAATSPKGKLKLLKKKRETLLENFEMDWYPKEWLAFVLLSAPGPAGMQRACLNRLDTTDAGKDLLPKNVRRAKQRPGNAPQGDAQVGTQPPPNNLRVHEVILKRPREDTLKACAQAAEKKLKLLRELTPDDKEAIDICVATLCSIYDKQMQQGINA